MGTYMKIESPNVKGQATDSKHADWIPVLSLHQDVRRPMAFQNGVASLSSVEFEDIMVITKMGKHVPELAQAVAKGTKFATITIEVCADTGAGSQEAYYKLILSDVHVSRLGVDANEGGGQADTISINLAAAKIQWDFSKWVGDTNEETVSKTWNVAKNAES